MTVEIYKSQQKGGIFHDNFPPLDTAHHFPGNFWAHRTGLLSETSPDDSVKEILKRITNVHWNPKGQNEDGSLNLQLSAAGTIRAEERKTKTFLLHKDGSTGTLTARITSTYQPTGMCSGVQLLSSDAGIADFRYVQPSPPVPADVREVMIGQVNP